MGAYRRDILSVVRSVDRRLLRQEGKETLRLPTTDDGLLDRNQMFAGGFFKLDTCDLN